MSSRISEFASNIFADGKVFALYCSLVVGCYCMQMARLESILSILVFVC